MDRSPAEQELLDVYDRLAGVLRDHAADLQPYQRANATKALAALWHVANGLDHDPGQVYDLRV